MLRERGEALEADFDRFYPRHPLEDLWTRKLSCRKASVLAMYLPPEAAIWRVGPDDSLWSPEKQELVSIRDEIRAVIYEPRPQPLPRPGDRRREQSAEQRALEKAESFKARQRAREQQAS